MNNNIIIFKTEDEQIKVDVRFHQVLDIYATSIDYNISIAVD